MKNINIFNIIFIITLFILFLLLTRLMRLSHENVPYYQYYNHPLLSNMSEISINTPFRMGSLYTMPGIVPFYGIESVDNRSPLVSRFYKDYFQCIVNPQLNTEFKLISYIYQFYQQCLTQNPDDHIENRKNTDRIKKAINQLSEKQLTINNLNISKASKKIGLRNISVDYLNTNKIIQDYIKKTC